MEALVTEIIRKLHSLSEAKVLEVLDFVDFLSWHQKQLSSQPIDNGLFQKNGEILFFPWWKIPEPVYFENFSLLPYQTGDCMEGFNQEIISFIENCMKHFYESSTRKIHSVTILSINAQVTYKVDEDLEAKLDSLIELVAFCGLSDRDFFSNGRNYCNRDNFQLKRFLIENNSVAYKKITRRRDGWNEEIKSTESYRETKPDHVIHSRVRLNEEFLKSLVSAQSSSGNWDDIFQGIVNFNLSNSDNSSTSETIEIVSLVGAFEQLLSCKQGKEKDLREKFVQLFDISINIDILDCERLRNRENRIKEKFKDCKSIQEVWIKDLFRLRGSLAHGNKSTDYPSLWTLKEHLLLSSFIFPLALKECLSKQNIYIKSHHDHQLIDFFPRILCQEDTSRWCEFWREFLWDQVAEQS